MTREAEIPAEHLRITAYPDRGKGGQHVGTASGVMIEHLPTGIAAVVYCERPQHSNKSIAIDMIMAALTNPRMRA